MSLSSAASTAGSLSLLLRPLARRLPWQQAGARQLSQDTSEEMPVNLGSDLEEQKSRVSIINEETDMIFFSKFGRYGFQLSTGVRVLGPVLAFPKTLISWKVLGPEQVTPESLMLLKHIFPRPDVFLLGRGDPRSPINPEAIRSFARQLKVNAEILPTEEALSTFNFLNSEGRYVVAALLPPESLEMFKEELDELQAKRRRFQLLSGDDLQLNVPSGSSAEAAALRKQIKAASRGEKLQIRETDMRLARDSSRMQARRKQMAKDRVADDEE